MADSHLGPKWGNESCRIADYRDFNRPDRAKFLMVHGLRAVPLAHVNDFMAGDIAASQTRSS